MKLEGAYRTLEIARPLWPPAVRVAIVLAAIWLIAELDQRLSQALVEGNLADADRLFWQIAGASFLAILLVCVLPLPRARSDERRSIRSLVVSVVLVLAFGVIIYSLSPRGVGRFGIAADFEWFWLGLPYLGSELGLWKSQLSAPLLSGMAGALLGRAIVDQLR